jgi:hypothetical protein
LNNSPRNKTIESVITGINALLLFVSFYLWLLPFLQNRQKVSGTFYQMVKKGDVKFLPKFLERMYCCNENGLLFSFSFLCRKRTSWLTSSSSPSLKGFNIFEGTGCFSTLSGVFVGVRRKKDWGYFYGRSNKISSSTMRILGMETLLIILFNLFLSAEKMFFVSLFGSRRDALKPPIDPLYPGFIQFAVGMPFLSKTNSFCFVPKKIRNITARKT